jgi:NAD(P)-dependent dehydrogenase (short-subunit alcohol dehydrogenase family)
MPDKTALITGAGSGIGRAIAILLDREDYAVGLIGRREHALRETAAELSGEALVLPTDITDDAAVKAAVQRAVDAWGRLDALVNNAAAVSSQPIEETTPAHMREMMAVNALGPAYAMHYCWSTFLKQRSGCVVNVSTMATLDPFPGFFAYAGTKMPVNMYVTSAAKEGAEHNIRAFAVAPGAVETDMLRSLFPKDKLPESQTLTPEKVAQVVVDCIVGRMDERNGEMITVPSP